MFKLSRTITNAEFRIKVVIPAGTDPKHERHTLLLRTNLRAAQVIEMSGVCNNECHDACRQKGKSDAYCDAVMCDVW